MPHSSRRALATLRRKYTHESRAVAAGAIRRDNDLGFDACTPAQRRLRALLTFYALNDGDIHDHDDNPGLARLTTYTIDPAPHRDCLVLVTNAPDNVAQTLYRKVHSHLGMPGIRLEHTPDYGTFHLRYLPTGARLIVTSRNDVDPRIPPASRSRCGRAADIACAYSMPLDDMELQAINAVPPMSNGIERLLAGLGARFHMRAPDNAWDLDWFHGTDLGFTERRRLSGTGTRWTLRWAGHPAPATVAAGLTDPIAGIAGATMRQAGDAWLVELAGSRLTLRNQPAMGRRVGRGDKR